MDARTGSFAVAREVVALCIFVIYGIPEIGRTHARAL